MKISRIIVGAAGIGALVIALTGCSGTFTISPATSGSSSQPTTSSASAPAATGTSAVQPTTVSPSNPAPAGVVNKPDTRCTNQINYAGDDRSNAEINSIGSDTSYCPPFQHKPDVKCTDQYVYTNDSRSNAEINSVGEETGHCPFQNG